MSDSEDIQVKEDLSQRPLPFETRIAKLEEELSKVKNELVQSRETLDKISKELPVSNIYSAKFIPRAFAVFGHNTVALILIAIPIWLLLIIITNAGNAW